MVVKNNISKVGAVAQSVEQRTENPCVAGSIPAHTTSKSFREIWSFFWFRAVLKALGLFLDQAADKINPIIRGWINYFGKFYPSLLRKHHRHIDLRLALWARTKFRIGARQ